MNRFIRKSFELRARISSSGFSARAARFRTVAFLLAFLQRTPADRIITAVSEFVAGSPIGAILRSTAAVVGAMGAIDTLAGATTLSATTPSPVSAQVGKNVNIGFTVTNTINIASWKIGGNIPTGLAFTAKEGGVMLTGPGTLDATTPGQSNGYGGTTGGNGTTTPILSGMPTQAGSYTITLQAYEFAGLTGLASDTFNYTVTVAAPTTTPAFTTQPAASTTLAAGGNLTLTVAVTGAPTPTIQWQKGGVAISGATNSTYTITGVAASDAGTYTAVATNSGGSTTSTSAVVTVTVPPAGPTFTLQPASQTMAAGTSVVLNAAVDSATSWQWQKNSVNIPGATSSTLLMANVSAANAGSYTVVATNAAGSTTSTAAALTINNATGADVGHLSNLSVRTFSGTGDQVLNVGFAVGGPNTSGSKPLLLRVVGPGLVPFGVSNTMADPMLTVMPLGSTNVVASNDDWAGNATVIQTANAVGDFALADPASKDAATVTTLSSGTYTALAAGKNNGTGIVLTEIYDATASANFTSSTVRLVNVSARAQVGTGDGVLIVGFAVAGSTSRTLLIRATGPALASFGVGGTLADPKLQVFVLSGPKLFENDNWGGSSVIANAAASVGAFAINDPNSKDAALLVTLPPGVYTAEVSGADGGTGISLVELYEVP